VGCELPSVYWTDQLLRGEIPFNVAEAEVALLGAIAIHPNEAVLHAGVRELAADGLEPRPLDHHQISLEDAMIQIGKLAAGNPRIRAIGETGLDYFRAGPAGQEVQKLAFRTHIALAKELGLALQIHDREAHAAVLEVLLQESAPDRTVFHCFSGDGELAELCVAQGWYLSFAGPVTYKANEALRQAVAATPLELLLVETDAPYLTPHPHRGSPNSPYLLPWTVRAIAEVKGVSPEQICLAVNANAERVYGKF
jgi:TatD DNase family protein